MVGTMMSPVQKASCQWPVSFQAAMSSGDKLCPFLTSRVSPRNVTYHVVKFVTVVSLDGRV